LLTLIVMIVVLLAPPRSSQTPWWWDVSLRRAGYTIPIGRIVEQALISTIFLALSVNSSGSTRSGACR